jgi:hypothetical protein
MYDENLMEEVVERHNMESALKQVRANKGSAGWNWPDDMRHIWEARSPHLSPLK